MDVKGLALYPQNFGIVILPFSSLSDSHDVSNQIAKQFQREQISALERPSRFSLFPLSSLLLFLRVYLCTEGNRLWGCHLLWNSRITQRRTLGPF